MWHARRTGGPRRAPPIAPSVRSLSRRPSASLVTGGKPGTTRGATSQLPGGEKTAIQPWSAPSPAGLAATGAACAVGVPGTVVEVLVVGGSVVVVLVVGGSVVGTVVAGTTVVGTTAPMTVGTVVGGTVRGRGRGRRHVGRRGRRCTVVVGTVVVGGVRRRSRCRPGGRGRRDRGPWCMRRPSAGYQRRSPAGRAHGSRPRCPTSASPWPERAPSSRPARRASDADTAAVAAWNRERRSFAATLSYCCAATPFASARAEGRLCCPTFVNELLTYSPLLTYSSTANRRRAVCAASRLSCAAGDIGRCRP